MSGYGEIPAARLSTRQVADRLGVKPETVYAYVSRGLLHSVRAQGGRGSWFDREDVDALAARTRSGRVGGPSAQDRSGWSGGTRTGQPDISTALTRMRDGQLFYRGLDITRLAQTESFESVVGLLWNGSLDRPPVFESPAATVELIRTVRAALPASARLPDLLRIIPPLVSATDPLRFDTRPGPVVAAAAKLMAVLVDALPYADGSETGSETDSAEDAQDAADSAPLSLARRLWPKLTARPATPEGVRALNAALIVLADHDLAVSTLAARVAASARAHPYAVVSAALGAFDGPLHGAAGSHSYRLVSEALATGDPVAAYAERLRAQGWVEGFGHKAYPDGDPRAKVLLDLLDRAVALHPDLRTVAEGLVETAHRHGRDLPNVDFALPVLAHVHGMVPDTGEVVFIIARTAGWIAHALEEYEEQPLRYRYQGTYRDAD